MATKQELVDKRNDAVANARKIIDENGDTLSEEHKAEFEAFMKEAGEHKDALEKIEAEEKERADAALRLQEFEASLERSPVSRDVTRLQPSALTRADTRPLMDPSAAVDTVVSAWVRQGRGAIDRDPELKTAFAASGCKWDTEHGPGVFIPLMRQVPQSMTDLNRIVAAQSVGTNTAGGHLTAPGFVPSVERAMLAFGGMRSVSTVIRSSTGSDLDMPTSDDTSNKGALLSENTQMGEQDITVGNLTLNSFAYTSKIVRVSFQLEQDNEVGFPALIGSMLGERLARIQNEHATTGTGSSQPNGIVTAATLGKTTASATAITVDELKDLKYSVDPAYRGGASWMFHDNVQLYIAKLKDGNDNYYWQPSVIAGEPDRFLNHPVTINQDMASSVATTNKTVLFGDLRKYYIREVMGITVIRLTERYADYGQAGYLALMRFDADLLDAGTNPVKYLQQA